MAQDRTDIGYTDLDEEDAILDIKGGFGRKGVDVQEGDEAIRVLMVETKREKYLGPVLNFLHFPNLNDKWLSSANQYYETKN